MIFKRKIQNQILQFFFGTIFNTKIFNPSSFIEVGFHMIFSKPV